MAPPGTALREVTVSCAIAPGSAVFRYDWIWPPEGGDPRPFEA